MRRRALGVTIAILAVAALGITIDGRKEDIVYPTIEALQRDLHAHDIGCPRLYPTGLLDTGAMHRAESCYVGSSWVTIHTYADGSKSRRLEEPSQRSGVSWAVGPNWLVATTDRPTAARVALAIGGDLIP